MNKSVKDYNFLDFKNYTYKVIHSNIKNNKYYSKEDIFQDCYFVFEKSKEQFDIDKISNEKRKNKTKEQLFLAYYRYRVYNLICKKLRRNVYPHLDNMIIRSIEKVREDLFSDEKIKVHSSLQETSEMIEKTNLLDSWYVELSERELKTLYLRGIINDTILLLIDVSELPKPPKKWREIDIILNTCKGGAQKGYYRIIKKLKKVNKETNILKHTENYEMLKLKIKRAKVGKELDRFVNMGGKIREQIKKARGK